MATSQEEEKEDDEKLLEDELNFRLLGGKNQGHASKRSKTDSMGMAMSQEEEKEDDEKLLEDEHISSSSVQQLREYTRQRLVKCVTRYLTPSPSNLLFFVSTKIF